MWSFHHHTHRPSIAHWPLVATARPSPVPRIERYRRCGMNGRAAPPPSTRRRLSASGGPWRTAKTRVVAVTWVHSGTGVKLPIRRIADALAPVNANRDEGDRALLLYPPGIEFIPAFFVCLYAGVIAVPAYPPRPERPGSQLPLQ